MEIIPCRCPKCNTSYEDYWDLVPPNTIFDSDVTLVYPITCGECGNHFEYIEVYELKHTIIEGQ